MPMHSYPIVDEQGRVLGRACVRERVRKCYTCSAPNASLTCDGCDHVLCTNCAVSPSRVLDFCPSCAKPAWLFFWQSARPEGDRAARRQSFRLWAREHAFKFLELAKKRTKKSLKEVPGYVDAPAHVDPMTPAEGQDE